MDHRKALQDGMGEALTTAPTTARTASSSTTSRCHNCRQVRHWSRDCPLNRALMAGSMTAGSFTKPPAETAEGLCAADSSGCSAPAYMPFCPTLGGVRKLRPNTYATLNEAPGRAPVDTAAQNGFIGQETLRTLDAHLQHEFGLRIQHSNEDGTVK